MGRVAASGRRGVPVVALRSPPLPRLILRTHAFGLRSVRPPCSRSPSLAGRLRCPQHTSAAIRAQENATDIAQYFCAHKCSFAWKCDAPSHSAPTNDVAAAVSLCSSGGVPPPAVLAPAGAARGLPPPNPRPSSGGGGSCDAHPPNEPHATRARQPRPRRRAPSPRWTACNAPCRRDDHRRGTSRKRGSPRHSAAAASKGASGCRDNR